MTTSGITTLNLTARDIITFALGKISANPIGQEVNEPEIIPVLQELNLMLKEWEILGPHLWRQTNGSVTLIANQPSYSLSVDNPLRISEVRYRYPSDGIAANQRDLPMEMMTREQYMTLPIKLSPGTPCTSWFFDPQETAQTIYIWPVPNVVSTDSLQYTFQRRFQVCTSLNNTLDIPQEWMSTVGYNLAERLLDDYGVETLSAQRIAARSQKLLMQAKAFDREDRINMVPAYRYRRR
jgi:hypothetical protein